MSPTSPERIKMSFTEIRVILICVAKVILYATKIQITKRRLLIETCSSEKWAKSTRALMSYITLCPQPPRDAVKSMPNSHARFQAATRFSPESYAWVITWKNTVESSHTSVHSQGVGNPSMRNPILKFIWGSTQTRSLSNALLDAARHSEPKQTALTTKDVT